MVEQTQQIAQGRIEELEGQVERLREDAEGWQMQAVQNLRQLTALRNEIKRARAQDPSADTIRGLFEHWKLRTGKRSSTRLTDDRFDAVKARLDEGYDVDDVRHAIEGAAIAAFVDKGGKVHNDLTLICRSGSKLEDFIERHERKVAGPLPLDPSVPRIPRDLARQITALHGSDIELVTKRCDCNHLSFHHKLSNEQGLNACSRCDCIHFDTLEQDCAEWFKQRNEERRLAA